MEQRLQLLCLGGVIDSEVRDGMLKVLDALENRWSIAVRNDQGIMALTHMASALMRSKQDVVIQGLDEELLQEIREAESYPQLQLIHQNLLQVSGHQVHPNEEGYLLANLYSLLQRQE
ncbi:PRD domain-containing protein [Serratia sp. S1B]|nr:PRD domain-containing protein [Serratia sp. S1B]